jgi:hypothetical protein
MRVSEFHQPEDVELAASNGINYMSFYNRVYNLGWTIKRASTEPLRTRDKSLWYKWRDTCKDHGVNQGMFFNRYYAGWGEENAATLPPGTKFKKPKPKLTPTLIELAAQHGIGKFALHARVHRYKWDLEKALTTPINEKFRRKS